MPHLEITPVSQLHLIFGLAGTSATPALTFFVGWGLNLGQANQRLWSICHTPISVTKLYLFLTSKASNKKFSKMK